MNAAAVPVASEATVLARLAEEQHLYALPPARFRWAEDIFANDPDARQLYADDVRRAFVMCRSASDVYAWADQLRGEEPRVNVQLVGDGASVRTTTAHACVLGVRVVIATTDYPPVIPTRRALPMVERMHRHGVL